MHCHLTAPVTPMPDCGEGVNCGGGVRGPLSPGVDIRMVCFGGSRPPKQEPCGVDEEKRQMTGEANSPGDSTESPLTTCRIYPIMGDKICQVGLNLVE